MLLKKWEELPIEMRTDEVRKYYDILRKKRIGLFFKRMFDIFVSLVMLIVLFPMFIVLAIAIKIDSKGPVFYRQLRVTQYGKTFRIFKFRTMVQNADKIGAHVTVGADNRITRVGRFIRKTRLDEICQLIDVLRGKMTFVGTRPEAVKYVGTYSGEMMATLLSQASEGKIDIKDGYLYTFPLFAQMFVFASRKESICNFMEWQDYGEIEKQKLLKYMINQIDFQIENYV